MKPSPLLIAIPCYNNGALIGGVLGDIAAINNRRSSTGKAPIDCLVIDDGSTDDSLAVAKAVAKAAGAATGGVAIERHSTNRGKGAAIQTALAYAREGNYSALVTVDADGQHPKDAIAALIAAAERDPAKLWLGVRQMDADPNIPASSRFGRRFSNGWVAIETGQKLADTQTGLRSYPLVPKLHAIARGIGSRHYDFEIAILVRSLWAGIAAAELAVPVHYPPPAERVSHFDGFWDNLRLSLLHSRLVTERLWDITFGKLIGFIKKATGIHGDAERKGSGITAWLLALGGKSLCVAVAILPVSFYFVADAKARRGIASLYSRMGLSDRSFKNFWWFALSIIDRLDFAKGTKKLPILTKAAGNVKAIAPGSIVLASHFGDWLFGGLRLTTKASELAILMDGSRTPAFMNQLKASAPLPITLVDSRQDPIPLILSLRETLSRGGVVCIMADRVVKGHTPIITPFLGTDAAFPAEPFKLAQMLSAPLYAFCATRHRGGIRAVYALHIAQLAANAKGQDTSELLGRYVTFLETRLKAAPHHWFNFFNFWQNAA